MSSHHLTTYPLAEIIAHARVHCPFYRDLYSGLEAEPTFEKLPIVDPDEFWKAHARDRWEILSDDLFPALVSNSGGTTGAPKNSYYSAEEWKSLSALSTRGFAGTGVQEGDRVANLFSAGDLHGSFLMVAESLRDAFPGTLQVPLGDAVPPERLIGALKAFNVNVLAGFPTPLLRLIERLDPAQDRIHLQRILFAGEIFSQDQRIYLERKYSGITIHSVGYGGVDAGLIGHADAGCGLGEHRAFEGATMVEIVDEETGQPIEECGRSGRVITTNLTRRLMPIIRYPAGDLAKWLDPEGTPARRFALLGRAQESARVAYINVPVTGVRLLLAPFTEELGITQFQLLVTREDRLDRLTLRIVADGPQDSLVAARPRILQKLQASNPEWDDLLAAGIIHPFGLDWVKREELIVSERTGKLRFVVDQRAG